MIEQGTPEWFAARLGKVTASRISDVMAKTKTGPAASRKNYAAELLLERVAGQRKDGYTSAAMQHGIDTEPLARLAYSIQRGVEVEEVGFIDHPEIKRTGASPDGLVGIGGTLEIKCPNTATHFEWAIAGVVPPEYVLQIQWQMACAGREWADFVSYDPRAPEGKQLYIRTVARDDKLIEEIANEVIKFDGEVEALIASVNTVQWF
jgi:putative phage-type endonuclease